MRNDKFLPIARGKKKSHPATAHWTTPDGLASLR